MAALLKAFIAALKCTFRTHAVLLLQAGSSTRGCWPTCGDLSRRPIGHVSHVGRSRASSRGDKLPRARRQQPSDSRQPCTIRAMGGRRYLRRTIGQRDYAEIRLLRRSSCDLRRALERFPRQQDGRRTGINRKLNRQLKVPWLVEPPARDQKPLISQPPRVPIIGFGMRLFRRKLRLITPPFT